MDLTQRQHEVPVENLYLLALLCVWKFYFL